MFSVWVGAGMRLREGLWSVYRRGGGSDGRLSYF